MHRRPLASWILPTLCGLLSAASAGAADDWPRFRGPNGTGVSADTDVPVQWSAAQGILWKVPVPGRGNSSPIIWGDKLFIQSSAADASERWLLCFNAVTGELLWKRPAPGGTFAKLNPNNSYASSTPATDGERVYAVFWDGKNLSLTACNFKGEPVWTRDLGSYESEHGAGISPMIYDGRVYVADDQGDRYETTAVSAVMAFNAKDGTDAWKATRKSFRASYSTPFILESEKGKPELIVASTAGVTSYDPAGGAENWKYTWSFSTHPLRTVASPIAAAGLVIANAGEGGKGRSLIAVKPGQGDVTATNLVWGDEKSFSYVPTLLASGDSLFCVNDDGFASCHDAKTGEEKWTKRLNG
ncbi:MAG TPA: PQQ-binding-like beta-propeller repeat protein, partial [Gemmataceae bacterium]|nr:PQQ-binding-like beta-propeller repeat protein [Gemmataceae bacterium]